MDVNAAAPLTSSVSWLDWLILIGLLASLGLGAWRGLVTEVMALAGWLVAYTASQTLGDDVSLHLPVGELGSTLNVIAGMVVAFVLAWVAWAFLSWVVGRMVRASVLSAPDRVLGAGFGAVRGLVVAMILCVLFSMTPVRDTELWQQSHGVAWLQATVLTIKPVLPDEVLAYLPA
jgi:membrane protein required for colicin V production